MVPQPLRTTGVRKSRTRVVRSRRRNAGRPFAIGKKLRERIRAGAFSTNPAPWQAQGPFPRQTPHPPPTPIRA